MRPDANSPAVSDLQGLGFDFHGLRIEVRSDNDVALGAIESRFRPFACEHLRPGRADAPVAAFSITHSATSLRSDPVGRPVYDTDLGEVLYRDDDDRLYIECGAVSVEADLSGGRVRTVYRSNEPETLALASHPLFTLPLLEICKRNGTFPLHAAGVVDDERAILIPAASGSGKTTLAIALARAGYGLLSDDMVFLRRGTSGIEVLSFPDELDITDATAAMFVETAHLEGLPLWGGRPKHQVRGEELGLDLAGCGRPALIVLPRLTHRPPTSFEDISASSALMEMVPNVLLTDDVSSQEHLDMLAELTASVPCVRCNLGTDLTAAVNAIAGLLA